jgi:hypothetical protein
MVRGLLALKQAEPPMLMVPFTIAIYPPSSIIRSLLLRCLFFEKYATAQFAEKSQGSTSNGTHIQVCVVLAILDGEGHRFLLGELKPVVLFSPIYRQLPSSLVGFPRSYTRRTRTDELTVS